MEVKSLSGELDLRLWSMMKGSAVDADLLAELSCEKLLGCAKPTAEAKKVKKRVPNQDVFDFVLKSSFFDIYLFLDFQCCWLKDLLLGPKKAHTSFNGEVSNASLKSADDVLDLLETHSTKLMFIDENFHVAPLLAFFVFGVEPSR